MTKHPHWYSPGLYPVFLPEQRICDAVYFTVSYETDNPESLRHADQDYITEIPRHSSGIRIHRWKTVNDGMFAARQWSIMHLREEAGPSCRKL